MFVHQLVSSDIPSLRMQDTGDMAMQLMQEHHIAHLPIVDGSEYKALIKEDDLLNWHHPDRELAESPFVALAYKPAVYANQHPYEAMRRAMDQNISVVPVIDDQGNYQGLVTRNVMLEFLSKNSGLDKSGGIITLELRPLDYSLSEIARICENNDVILLNVQIFTHADKEAMEVVLKTNTRELQALLASFERYEYTVKDVFGDLPASESMIDRYQSLMHFINM
ncbi:MAG: CBS domain-containing protein [Edaphocola sp.]